MQGNTSYEQWSHEQLIAKINDLEEKLTAVSTPGTAKPAEAHTSIDPSPYRKPPKQPPKAFDASKYSSRYIALKFAYLGQNYQGFEHHANNNTPLPTVEEDLWKALMKTRLINPTKREGEGDEYAKVDRQIKGDGKHQRQGADVNWEGCEYSKCGRTDRGVSAFGQVIGIRVRSNRPLPKPKTASPPPETVEIDGREGVESSDPQEGYAPLPSDSETEDSGPPFDDIADELPYIEILNRVLPPEIRVYAWCPSPPPNFSARFSCKERRYKYFFTNPCFLPPPGPSGVHATLASGGKEETTTMRDGWLDIAKMQEACNHLVGLHDFRNFCKIDPSKQLTTFQRRIFHAEIEEVSPLSLPSFLAHGNIAPTPTPPPNALEAQHQQPKLYAFTVHGSAFLWHQVRSLVAILFLVGQGLEAPSVVPALLDIDTNPTRPQYQMASDAPLVLWDCIFPHADEVQTTEERTHGYEDRLEWVYTGDGSKGGVLGKGKWGNGGIMEDAWEMWRRNKIDETISGLLLDRLAGLGKGTLDAEAYSAPPAADKPVARGITEKLFEGGNLAKSIGGSYVPLMKRPRCDPVEVVNRKYAERKGLNVKQLPLVDEDAA